MTDSTTVTIVCGTVLALFQAYIAYRLKEQDASRDAARADQKKAAADLEKRTERAAVNIERKLIVAGLAATAEREEIHQLVNGRVATALARVEALEAEVAALKAPRPGPN